MYSTEKIASMVVESWKETNGEVFWEGSMEDFLTELMGLQPKSEADSYSFANYIINRLYIKYRLVGISLSNLVYEEDEWLREVVKEWSNFRDLYYYVEPPVNEVITLSLQIFEATKEFFITGGHNVKLLTLDLQIKYMHIVDNISQISGSTLNSPYMLRLVESEREESYLDLGFIANLLVENRRISNRMREYFNGLSLEERKALYYRMYQIGCMSDNLQKILSKEEV